MGIQIKELRIGNFIRHHWIDKAGISRDYNSIKFISLDFVSVDSNVLPSYHTITEITPIPLTEEWFIKSGGEYELEWEAWRIPTKTGEINLSKHEKGWMLNSTDTLCIIRFVHQYQNLYFALTGEELELKE